MPPPRSRLAPIPAERGDVSPSIRELSRQRIAEHFVGRERELDALLAPLAGGGPLVRHIHGVAGIGKTALLAAFAGRARDAGACVIELDCRALEPTERGLLTSVSGALGARSETLQDTISALARLEGTVALALDHYEVFRLTDAWIRQVFIPALSDNVRVVIAGREPPVAGWMSAPELSEAVQVLALGPLEVADALTLLIQLGVPEESAALLNRHVRGHPLAIRLAAAARADRPELGMEEVGTHAVIEKLTKLYLADVPDPVTRRALQAACVVRRTTASLLGAILPDLPTEDALERIAELPFVEARADGLVVHELVQNSLAKSLRASDPQRHRQYRRAAWRQLRREVREAGHDELWRYTADMLYLIENPVVREAFFPTDVQPLAVEPASARDLSTVELIAARHDGDDGARIAGAWWRAVPEAFSVIRDRDGLVIGFFYLLDRRAIMSAAAPDDPVVAGWREHLREHPVSANAHVLGFRRWLDLEHGELPCASQAAAWLDVKRTYMQLRPELRRIYTVVESPPTYLPVVSRLGFRPLDEAATPTSVHGRDYTSVVLDFGPGSVDGWLAGLVATELGLADELQVDAEARELVIADRRVQLTPLEFAVLTCLQQREGRSVTRAALLEEVWGYRSDIGSNVVDAVVRRLRAKIGEQYAVVETVRGSGYRLTIQ